MDDLLANTLANVISDVIKSIATFGSSNLADRKRVQQKSPQDYIESLKLHTIAVSTGLKPETVDQILLFLRQPQAIEVFEIYWIAYGTKSNSSYELREIVLEALRGQIHAQLIFRTALRGSEVKLAAEMLHEMFSKICRRAVEGEEQSSSILKPVGKGNPPYEWIIDEAIRTSAIRSNLSLDDVASTARLREAYSRQFVNRFGSISPVTWNGSARVSIGSIYIQPVVKISDPNFVDATTSASELLGVAHHAVILGDPGAGKSTFMQAYGVDLALEILQNSQGKLPILVRIRDYAAERDSSIGLLPFILKTLRRDLNLQMSRRQLQLELMFGSCVLLFDGLDEVLSHADRSDVVLDIESFMQMNPRCPVIATSRAVGYDDAPLSDSLFLRALMQPFTDVQVSEYVHKWFFLQYPKAEWEAERLAGAFMTGSSEIKELRSNPLLLGLLCTLFADENYIPRERLEVYGRCAMMLFERWDKRRNIEVKLPFAAHAKFAVGDLAAWILKDQTRQAGVTRGQLVNHVAKYLHGKVYETEEDCLHAADAFVDWCLGRAWVFTDVGENNFQFTHRTFLEYFASVHFSRSMPVDTMWTMIRRDLIDSSQITSQLLMAQVAEMHEGGADIILLKALDSISRGNRLSNSNWATLEWMLWILEAIVPDSSTRRKLGQLCAKFDSAVLATDANPWFETPIPRAFQKIQHTRHENCDSLSNAYLDYLIDALRRSQGDDDSRAVRLLASLAVQFDEILPNIRARIATEFQEKRLDLSPDMTTRISLHLCGIVDLPSLVGQSGLSSLFPMPTRRGSSRAVEMLLAPDRYSKEFAEIGSVMHLYKHDKELESISHWAEHPTDWSVSGVAGQFSLGPPASIARNSNAKLAWRRLGELFGIILTQPKGSA